MAPRDTTSGERFKALLEQAASPAREEPAQNPARLAAVHELRHLCIELEQIAEAVPLAWVDAQMHGKLDRLSQLAEQTNSIEPLPIHYADQLDIALIRLRSGTLKVTTADLDRVKAHFLKWHAPAADGRRQPALQRLWCRLLFKLTHRYPAYYEEYRQKWPAQLPADQSPAHRG